MSFALNRILISVTRLLISRYQNITIMTPKRCEMKLFACHSLLFLICIWSFVCHFLCSVWCWAFFYSISDYNHRNSLRAWSYWPLSVPILTATGFRWLMEFSSPNAHFIPYLALWATGASFSLVIREMMVRYHDECSVRKESMRECHFECSFHLFFCPEKWSILPEKENYLSLLRLAENDQQEIVTIEYSCWSSQFFLSADMPHGSHPHAKYQKEIFSWNVPILSAHFGQTEKHQPFLFLFRKYSPVIWESVFWLMLTVSNNFFTYEPTKSNVRGRVIDLSTAVFHSNSDDADRDDSCFHFLLNELTLISWCEFLTHQSHKEIGEGRKGGTRVARGSWKKKEYPSFLSGELEWNHGRRCMTWMFFAAIRIITPPLLIWSPSFPKF